MAKPAFDLRSGPRFEQPYEKVTSSPVIGCSRDIESPGRGPVTVWTQDGKSYRASKVNGKWKFEQVIVLI